MLSYEIRLDAESVNGGNNWISGSSNGIERKTGESGNYRVFYSFSSTTFGVFNDIIIEIDLQDEFDNIESFFSVGISAGASYTTDYSGNTKKLIINLGSNIPAGQSGFISFSVQSKTNRGPDGYHITSSALLEGTFLDSGTQQQESFSADDDGPYWEVSAYNPHSYKKSVTINGNVYMPDADAYVVQYSITDSVTTPEGEEGIGTWGYTSVSVIDTLPKIGNVNPEVLYSNITPYTVNGNQVIWQQKPPNNVFHPIIGYNMILRVRYPKAAVDAVGGLAALGEITNKIDVIFDLIGGVEDIKSAEVTHRINPIPPAALGSMYTVKGAPGYNDQTPFPGNGLYYNDGRISFTIRAGMLNTNILSNEQLITDLPLSYTLEDGSIVPLTGESYSWYDLIITTVGNTGQLEYATNLNPSFTPGPTVGQTRVRFPVLPAGEYITSWRVRINDNYYPSNIISMDVVLILKKRPANSQKILTLNNSVINEIFLSTGQNLSDSYTVEIPFVYDKDIYWELPALNTDANGVSLGSSFQVRTSHLINELTSVAVLGTDLYMLIPDDFIFIQSGSAPSTTIINWNGTGKTLLHAQFPAPVPAITRYWFNQVFNFMVSPAAALGLHTLEAYYTVNSQQANDPEITLNPMGSVAPDIYDFDQNGDTSQLIPFRSIPITLAPVNKVNVLKMSKALNDSDFQINNDTQITSGEIFNYKFLVRNDSSEGMTYVTIIDIFPYPGDVFGSTWAPYLLSIPSVPDNVTVSYSLSVTPKMEPILSTGDGEWFSVPPEDLSLVKAIKFDFGDKIYQPGEGAEIYLDMRAPLEAVEYSKAYNSVNYIASAISNGIVTEYLPAFSPPAYAQLTFRAFDNFVGDFVWTDLNGNGIIDPGEPGINGIAVKLLSTNGTEDEVGTVVYETVTANHPVTGEPGYYEFTGIWPASYIASFPISLEDGSVLTTRRVGSDPEINSVPHVDTGLSDPFTVSDGSRVDDIDAGYVPVVPSNGSIGDFVWYDINSNGIQDPGEPGINGVYVALYSSDGTLLSSQYTGNNHISGEPGYYEFSGLSLGQYRVFFQPKLDDENVLTLANVGPDENINSKPDPVTGFTELISLIDDSTVLNMDAGYIKPPMVIGTIGDYVWQDVNKNGIQDLNEPGINGVTVQLLNPNGVFEESTVTANHPFTGKPGFYQFLTIAPGRYDVPPGEYKVVFPTSLADSSSLTIQNTGTDPSKNSRPNQQTGETDVFTVDEGENISDIDAGYILPEPPKASIGNFVWNDINRNGIQDIGEPGINGVRVTLVNQNGNAVAETITSSSHGGQPGYYYFDDVEPGTYSVQFPQMLTSGYTLTVQNAGADSSLNSSPNPATGLTPQFTVVPGEINFAIDAGYIQREYTADLGITKSADRTDAVPGDVINYSLHITNYGPDAAENALLTDTVVLENLTNLEYSLDGGINWNNWTGILALGDMAFGDTISLIGRGTVALQPGSIVVNTALVSSTTTDPNPYNNIDTVTVPVISGDTLADLAVVKSADKSSAVIGDVLTYSLHITNYGPDTAENALLTDLVVLDNLTHLEYSLDGGITWNSWTGTLALGDMAFGDTISLIGRGIVALEPGNSVVNTAIVSSTTTDPNHINNTDTVTVPVIPADTLADLAIHKSADKYTAEKGEVLTYTLLITNYGPNTAENALLTDTVVMDNLTHLEYSIDGGVSWDVWRGSLLLGDLASGASVTIIGRGTVILDPGDVVINEAVVSSTTTDPNPYNNIDTVTVPVIEGERLADLAVVKSVDKSSTAAGEILTYTMLITNYGPDTAGNVFLADEVVLDNLINLEYSLDMGTTWNSWAGMLPLGDLDPGDSVTVLVRGRVISSPGDMVINAAIITSTTTDPNPDNNIDTVIVPVIERERLADLAVDKCADRACAVTGDTLTYTISVTNHGPDTAINTLLSDYISPENLLSPQFSVDGGISWNSWTDTILLGDLVSGESVQIRIKGTIPFASASNITNTASVLSDTADPNSGNNKDSLTIPWCEPACCDCCYPCCYPCRYPCCYNGCCYCPPKYCPPSCTPYDKY